MIGVCAITKRGTPISVTHSWKNYWNLIEKNVKKTHKEKVKLADKMLTGLEKKLKIPKFQSHAWSKRSESIKKRVAKNGSQKKKDK